MNANRYIMRDYSCVGVQADGVSVTVMDCAMARAWDYDESSGTLKQNGIYTNCTFAYLQNAF